MGRRGRHRDYRDRVLDQVEKNDPALYAELVELRGSNPQEYRKRIREAVKVYPIDGSFRLLPNRLVYSHVQHVTEIEEILACTDVYSLRAALRRGNFDGRIDLLEAAERAGRNRPLILYQLEEFRIREARDAAPRPQVPPVSDWVQKVENVVPRLQLPEGEDG